jgi:hypothetical protein
MVSENITTNRASAGLEAIVSLAIKPLVQTLPVEHMTASSFGHFPIIHAFEAYGA